VGVGGAVGLGFDRRFLTASHWFKKDPLGGAVRESGSGARWRPAVSVFTTARGSESLRMRRVGGWRPRLVGAEDQEQGLRRALCNGGWGRAALLGGGRCLWSPLSRIPRRCRRLTEAGRSGGVKPDHTCWPAETLGLTPPARPAWLRPPTATRDPGPPHLWEEIPRLMHGNSPPPVRHEVDPVHTTRVVSRIPRRCRRALPTSPAWRCQAGRDRWPAACDPA